MKRIVFVILTGLLLAALPAGAQVVSRIAAVVNDEVITTAQLDQEVDRQLTAEAKAQDLTEEMRRKLREEVLPLVIEETLVSQRARKLGIHVSDEEVDRAIEDVLKQNGIGSEQLAEALAAQGLTMAAYRVNLGRQLLNFKLVGREIRSETEVTNQELRNYFQEHLEDYREPPFIRLSRISFFFAPGIGSSRIADLRTRSQEALQRLRGGESFDDVVSAYTGDKGGEGGPMGTFGEGELAEPFISAVAGLTVGQVSDVVETPQGFHILRLDEKNPGRIPAFEEVRDRISSMILERKRKEAISGWTEKLKKEAHIEVRL
jgi:peptidyl-prolyl cis-trans isomerase SurA